MINPRKTVQPCISTASAHCNKGVTCIITTFWAFINSALLVCTCNEGWGMHVRDAYAPACHWYGTLPQPQTSCQCCWAMAQATAIGPAGLALPHHCHTAQGAADPRLRRCGYSQWAGQAHACPEPAQICSGQGYGSAAASVRLLPARALTDHCHLHPKRLCFNVNGCLAHIMVCQKWCCLQLRAQNASSPAVLFNCP